MHYEVRQLLSRNVKSDTCELVRYLSYSRGYSSMLLTNWGRVTHICLGNLTIIGSDNGLSPGRRQAITWTNVGILLMGPLGTNFSEMLIEIHTSSFNKIHLKMSSGKWQPFCLGLSVLIQRRFIYLQSSYITTKCVIPHQWSNPDEYVWLWWNSAKPQ